MSQITKKRWKLLVFHVAVLLWTALILSFSMQTAVDSSGKSDFIVSLLQKIGLTDISQHFIRKCAHFVEFAVLGILLMLARNTSAHAGAFSALRPFYPLYALLVPLCDETVQSFYPGRSPQISDVWLDFAGAVTGAAVCFCILWLCGKEKRRRK